MWPLAPLVAMPDKSFTTGPDDTELQVYDYAFLTFESANKFPKATINSSLYDTHGRFVFFEDNGARAWAVVQVDASSGALLDFGVVRYDVLAPKDPLTTDVSTVSITSSAIRGRERCS